MFKRKLISSALAVSLLTITALTGCGSTASNTAGGSNGGAGGVVELDLGHVQMPGAHYYETAAKLKELVETKSNGAMKINVFPQAQLGGEVKLIQSAITGSLGMIISTHAPMENTVKEYMIFDLPYLFDSIDQGNKVLEGPVGQKYLDMLQQHGLVGLGWLSVMERNVYASKPVRSPEDLKSMKIRVMQSPGYLSTYQSLKAQPTPMSTTEVYVALQQGAVDGGEGSPDNYVTDKFAEVSKYYSKTKLHHAGAVLMISKIKWDALTPDQQKILREASNEALAYGKAFYKKSYEDSINAAKALGVTIVDTDLESFKKAAQPVYDTLLKDIPNGKALYEEIEKAKSQ